MSSAENTAARKEIEQAFASILESQKEMLKLTFDRTTPEGLADYNAAVKEIEQTLQLPTKGGRRRRTRTRRNNRRKQ